MLLMMRKQFSLPNLAKNVICCFANVFFLYQDEKSCAVTSTDRSEAVIGELLDCDLWFWVKEL